jgi:hypothetical protein
MLAHGLGELRGQRPRLDHRAPEPRMPLGQHRLECLLRCEHLGVLLRVHQYVQPADLVQQACEECLVGIQAGAHACQPVRERGRVHAVSQIAVR